MLQDKVDIFSFSDPRDYLRAVLASKKKKDKSFRLSAFSREVGFASPSLLSMLLKGKRRLAPSAADKLARSLCLTGKRKSYFLAMTHSQALKTNAEQKIQAHEAMLLLKSKVERTYFKIDQFQCLTNWYYSALCTLAGTAWADWSALGLAKKVGRGITTSEIEQALATLENLSLIVKEGSRYRRTAEKLCTDEDVRHLALPKYHREMNRLADEALNQPIEDREFNGLTVAIPKSRLPEVKEKIRKFRRELHESLLSTENNADEVYQFNLQLFRLTTADAVGETP